MEFASDHARRERNKKPAGKPYWRRKREWERENESETTDITHKQRKRSYGRLHEDEIAQATRAAAAWACDLPPDVNHTVAGHHDGRTVYHAPESVWRRVADEHGWNDIVRDIVQEQHEGIARTWGLKPDFVSCVVAYPYED